MLTVRFFTPWFLILALFTGAVSAVPLQNGDFASFDGWSGDKDDGTLLVTLVDEAGLGPDGSFDRGGGHQRLGRRVDRPGPI